MLFKQFARPKTPSDLIFADKGVESDINNYVNSGAKSSLILEGPYGTGKSTIARVILSERSKHVPGLDPKFWTIEASNFKSIDLIESSFSLQLYSNVPYPLVVINEFDQLNSQVQLDIRTFWDDRSHIGGLILTTNHFDRIDPGIADRFTCHRIDCPKPADLLPMAKTFLAAQNVVTTDEKLLNVMSAANQSIRKIEAALDALVDRLKMPSAATVATSTSLQSGL